MFIGEKYQYSKYINVTFVHINLKFDAIQKNCNGIIIL